MIHLYRRWKERTDSFVESWQNYKTAITTEGAISFPKVEHESDQKYDFRSATSLSPTMKHVLGNATNRLRR